MATSRFGINAFLESDQKYNTQVESQLASLSTSFIYGRVRNIDASPGPSNGEIQCEILSLVPKDGQVTVISALPLFPNIKNYPLVNETVLLFSFISSLYGEKNSPIWYYLTPSNIFNNPQQNELPNPISDNLTPSSQQKSIQEVEAGSSNKLNNGEINTNFKAGINFPQNLITHPLYPYEGDVIIEGRFGNSIRFGSTNTATASQSPINWWSEFGGNGSPITIIRNGQNPNLPPNEGVSRALESIKYDPSEIILTSTQQIPVEVSSATYDSYSSLPHLTPINSSLFGNRPQIILNSGRLVFNTTEDHILLSSKKTINLNSLQGIFIDTKGTTTIQCPEIYLGDSEVYQPVVLGNDLKELLNDLLNELKSLTFTLSNQITPPQGSPLAPTSIVADVFYKNIENVYLSRLEGILSKTTNTA